MPISYASLQEVSTRVAAGRERAVFHHSDRQKEVRRLPLARRPSSRVVCSTKLNGTRRQKPQTPSSVREGAKHDKPQEFIGEARRCCGGRAACAACRCRRPIRDRSRMVARSERYLGAQVSDG